MSDLKELRKRSGVSQVEAAKILGVSTVTLQSWENGVRNPKNREEIEAKLSALTILTREGINAILSGDVPIETALREKKIDEVKKLSKWGRYGDTFSANWRRIPTGIKDKLDAAELAELVDAIKAAYDAGRDAGPLM